MPDPNQNNSNRQNSGRDNQEAAGTHSSHPYNPGLSIRVPPASRPPATQEPSQGEPNQNSHTLASNPMGLWVDTSVGRTGTFEIRYPLAPTAAGGSDPMRPLESDQQQPTQSQQNNRVPR